MADLAGLSDAQLFRIARALAKHESEIAAIHAELQQERAKLRAINAEVKATKVAVKGSSAKASLKGSAAGLQAGPVGFKGGKFSLQGKGMRGAQNMFLIFGAVNTAGSMAQQWTDTRAIRDKLGGAAGRDEALTRIGRQQLRNVLVAPAEGVVDAIGALLEAGAPSEKVGRARRAAYVRRFQDLWRSIPGLGETVEEELERKRREHTAFDDAGRKNVQFVDEQLIRPIKENGRNAAGFVRTAREANAIMARLWKENDQSIRDLTAAVAEATKD